MAKRREKPEDSLPEQVNGLTLGKFRENLFLKNESPEQRFSLLVGRTKPFQYTNFGGLKRKGEGHLVVAIYV
jgi:hypothetical protein